MRLLFLALALTACSSDPAPPVDAGTADTGMIDSGWPWADGGLDAGARCTPGTQGTCACLPGPMRAVYVCPASGVPPEPCPCAEDRDGAVRDAQATDLGVDAVTKDWPFEDRPAPLDVADVPRADVPPDAGCTELFCGGRCVDNSAMNCGACGVVCTATLPHTRPACSERDGGMVCEWGCETGWGNCDGDPANGCEYTLFGVDSGFCPRP